MQCAARGVQPANDVEAMLSAKQLAKQPAKQPAKDIALGSPANDGPAKPSLANESAKPIDGEIDLAVLGSPANDGPAKEPAKSEPAKPEPAKPEPAKAASQELVNPVIDAKPIGDDESLVRERVGFLRGACRGRKTGASPRGRQGSPRGSY